MMPCPSCGLAMHVSDSRKTSSGIIRRRRWCARCETRSTTYEIEASVLEAIYAVHGRLKTAAALIAQASAIEVPDLPKIQPAVEAKNNAD